MRTSSFPVRRLFVAALLCVSAALAAESPAFEWKAALLKREAGKDLSLPFGRPVEMADGDSFKLYFSPAADCRLLLLYEGPGGLIDTLYDGAVKAGAVFLFPEGGQELTLEPPAGTERFHFIVARERPAGVGAAADRLKAGDAKSSAVLADAVAALRKSLSRGAEAPEKPVPMGGVSRGSPQLKAYAFAGAADYVKTIRIIH